MRQPASKRTRNLLNAMIVALLFAILLFLYVGKIFQQKSAETEQEMQLIRIDYGSVQLLKRDEHWQFEPSRANADANNIGQEWERVLASDAPLIPGSLAQGQHVLLYFSGRPQPLLVKLGVDAAGKPAIEFVTRSQRLPISESIYLKLNEGVF